MGVGWREMGVGLGEIRGGWIGGRLWEDWGWWVGLRCG